MKTFTYSFRLLLLLGACLTGWGCVSPVSELERPCPCAEGWTCCEQNQRCVQEATQCPGGAADSTAPSAPRLASVLPGSPTAQARVTVAGTSEPNATVHLFGDPACAGPRLGEAKADTAGGFRVEVALAPNATTALYGVAVDAAGNVSLCSAEPLRVTHDGQAPAAPVLAETVPASPSATHLSPVLSGTAEPEAFVRVYAEAGCEGALSFETRADTAGTFRVSVRVERNTPTTFWARATDAAGNASACSSLGLSYTHDDVPPLGPTQVETVPTSPSNVSVEPLWKGLTEPGALVRVYAEEGCLGVSLVEVRADAEGRFGVRQTARANGSISRWARVLDVAGNTSACFPLGTYVHDDIAPAAPLLSPTTEPVSPSNKTNSPTFRGTTEPGATVLILEGETSGCPTMARASDKADATGLFRVQLKTTETRSYTTSVRARAMDVAGNLSPCSSDTASYQYDINPPRLPYVATFKEPSPSASHTYPALLMGHYSNTDEVQVYTNPSCTSRAVVRSASYEDVFYNIALSVSPNTDTTFYVTVTDKAGNSTECFSPELRYVHTENGRGWLGEWNHYQLSSAAVALDDEGHAFQTALTAEGGPPRAVVWRTDALGAFGTPYELSRTPYSQGGPPGVVANSRGDAVVTWWESDRSLRAVRYTVATGWSASVEVIPAGRGADLLELELDEEGKALAMWREVVTSGGTIQVSVVARSAAAGAEWGALQAIAMPSPSADFSTQLVTTPWGGLLLWRRSSPGTSKYEQWGLPYKTASGWGEPHLINPDSLGITVAVDAGGTVWLVSKRFLTDSTSKVDLWAQSLAPGAEAWSEPELLVSNLWWDASDVRLVGGRAGEAMVVWGDFEDRGAFGRATSRHHAADGTWGEPMWLGDPSNSYEYVSQLRLVAGRDGELYAVYVQRFGPTPTGRFYPNEWLRLRRFTPSGGWEPQVQTLATGYERMLPVGLAGNARGELLVLWKQYNGSIAPSIHQSRWLR